MQSQGLSPRMTALRCVSVSTRNMIVSKAVVFAAFLLATLDCISTQPHSSIIRERHIIRAPINFRVIHHYKIQRVPLIIEKHLHYHKPYAQEATAAPEETRGGHASLQDGKEYVASGGVHPQDEGKVSGWRGEEGKGYPFGLGGFGVPWRSPGQEKDEDSEEEEEEEDYEEVEESEDGDYE